MNTEFTLNLFNFCAPCQDMLVKSPLVIALVLSLKKIVHLFENIKFGNCLPVLFMALSRFIMDLFVYLPYGINNWIWWNAFSRLVNNNKMLDFEF